VFYTLASTSGWYDHKCIIDGGIYLEIYAKRALGILLYKVEPNDSKTLKMTSAIYRKGWPRAYKFIQENKEIDYEAFFNNALSGRTAPAAMELFTETMIIYWLAINQNIPFIKNEKYEIVIGIMENKQRNIADDSFTYIYAHLSDSEQKKIDDLKERLFQRLNISISDLNYVVSNDERLTSYFHFLLRVGGTERFGLNNILKDVNLNENDVLEVFSAYYQETKSMNSLEAADYFLFGITAKGLLKALRQSKEQFFQYNSEYNSLKVEIQQSEYDRLDSENVRLRAQVDRLLEENRILRSKNEIFYKANDYHELEAENARLKVEMDKNDELLRDKDLELIGLRDYFFSTANAGEAEWEVRQEELLDLSDTVGAIIGGSPKWQSRMKELLPKWLFISSEGFDKKSIENMKTICFCSQYLSHKMYYKAINIARSNNIVTGYVNSQNDRLAMREISGAVERSLR